MTQGRPPASAPGLCSRGRPTGGHDRGISLWPHTQHTCVFRPCCVAQWDSPSVRGKVAGTELPKVQIPGHAGREGDHSERGKGQRRVSSAAVNTFGQTDRGGGRGKHPGKTHLGVSSLQRGPSHHPDPARWGSACEKPRQTRGQAAVRWERPQPYTLQDGGWSQNVTQTPGNRTQALCPQRTIPWRGTVGGSPRGGPRPRGFRSLLVHRKLSFPTAVCHRILPCDSPGCRPHPLSSSRTQGGKWCPVIYGRTQRNDPQGTGL